MVEEVAVGMALGLLIQAGLADRAQSRSGVVNAFGKDSGYSINLTH